MIKIYKIIILTLNFALFGSQKEVNDIQIMIFDLTNINYDLQAIVIDYCNGWQLYKKLLNGYTNSLNKLIYSRDGKYLASADDNTIKIWNIHTGDCAIKLHEKARQIEFSPNGKHLAIGHIIHLKTIDLETQKNELHIKIFNGIRSMSYSRCGNFLALGSGSNGFIKLIDTNTNSLNCGNCIISLKVHETESTSICFLPSIEKSNIFVNLPKSDDIKHNYEILGKFLVSASRDNIKIMDVSTGNCILTLVGHERPITNIMNSNCGKYLVSGSDNGIKVWNINTGDCIKRFDHNAKINSIGFSLNNRQIICGTEGIKIFDNVRTNKTYGECIQMLNSRNYYNCHANITVSPCGKYFACDIEDKSIGIFENLLYHALNPK